VRVGGVDARCAEIAEFRTDVVEYAVHRARVLVKEGEGNAMLNTNLALIGWVLFCWVAFLYIFWVLVERTFFVASDPDRCDRHTLHDEAGSTAASPHPTPHFPRVSTLDRPA
jgi:hypothetical protein